MTRRDLLPGSALPLAYFALSHLGLITALGLLVVEPDLPGGYFLHPRMVALVHLVTIAWISGSILGAFYVVAPVALGVALPVARADWAGWAAFAIGASGMATHFWIGEYSGMVWSAGLVLGTIAWVARRALPALVAAPVPWGVTLHVVLAFANVLAAGTIGMLLGLTATRGLVGASPIAAAFAHAHLAAVGWALMMVVGLAYRLLPMILPAKPPAASGLAASAVLIEAGLIVTVASLLTSSPVLPAGGLLIAAGVVRFAGRMRRVAASRLPRPPALPRVDWSAWQVHGALLWIAAAVVLGLSLTVLPAGPGQIVVAWVYGVAGLVGGLSQVVVGMQGRLVPLYAYYRAMAAGDGTPPERSSHRLVSSRFAAVIFTAWTIGVPWLAWGLATSHAASIRGASLVLAAGVVVNATYLGHMMREARAGSAPATPTAQANS